MKQEFGEVQEPVPAGTVGSSTMPQKRNPEAVPGDHRRLPPRSAPLVPLALEAMQTEHEADRTTSIMMSRALVQACELTGDVLQRMIALFAGLQVFPERMRQNLDLIGRPHHGGGAHARPRQADRTAAGPRRGLRRGTGLGHPGAARSARCWREDPSGERPQPTPAQVEALLDPARYTGLCREFAERGAARGREIAAAIELRLA